MNRIYYTYELYVEGEELPFYVGKTYSGGKRLRKHKYSSKRGEKTLKGKYIRKALREGKKIKQKIVFRSRYESRVFDKEKELIKFYGRKDNGTGILCNHTDGGEGGPGRQLIDHSGKKYGRLLVLKCFQVGAYNTFTCLCECGVQKDIRGSSILSGAVVSCGCYNRDKAVNTKGNIRVLPENRVRYVKKTNPKKRGIKFMSAAHREKIRLKSNRPVCAYSVDGELIGCYNSLNEASAALNINKSTISANLNNRIKIVGKNKKYIFKYQCQ